MGGIEEDCLYQ